MEEVILEKRRQLSISDDIPFTYSYNAEQLKGCCENVIGYIPVPLGAAGLLPVDGVDRMIPLATTEGALIASINRGCKLLKLSAGTRTIVTDEGITRAPVIGFESAQTAYDFCNWTETEYISLKEAFDATSSYAKLTSIDCKQVGRQVYMRVSCLSGNAMGMNMIGKGTEAILKIVEKEFPNGEIISISGNYCTDKKASALNWISGRGKSVIAEAFIEHALVEQVLHCSVEKLLKVYQSKCLVGSSLAGCIGGNNAHAANIIAAIFIACGQDVAQLIDSSFCMLTLEATSTHLYASVTMPCLQVGTVGGGTRLPPQFSCISMMTGPDRNACSLARIIASAVLAGELSLLGSLAEGSLMSAHLKLNRP